MENLYIHSGRVSFYIKILFGILSGFFIMIALSLFLLEINDSVDFTTGEIISEVPQLDVKAPYEAIPMKVMIKEGQTVSIGDTLMILSNEEVRRAYRDAESTVIHLTRIDSTIEELIHSCYEKIDNLKKEKRIAETTYAAQREKQLEEVMAASQRTSISRQKLNTVAETKLKIDSALYGEKVISKLDITNSFDAYASYKNTLLELQIAENQARAALKTIENAAMKTKNELDLKVIELNEQIKELTRQKELSEKELITARSNLTFLHQEVNKQYIISDINGEVYNLFNVKFEQNFVNKGDVLLSLVPTRDQFYAKVIVPQRQVRFIKPGQQVHLKIDAYYYFEKGILRGTVDYVPERKPRDDFFVIISLEQAPEFDLKAGYSLKGEIIIERLKIYQFIIKKLLRKIDKVDEPITQPSENQNINALERNILN